MESTSLNAIFLHGAGGSGDVFAHQLAAFPGAIAPTLPGHRGEETGPASIAEFAKEIAGMLDALSAERVVVCGHSMGGAIAIELALSGDPRVAGVVAIGSGARMRVAPAFLEAMERDFPAAVKTFAGSFFARPDPALVNSAVATMLAVGRDQTLRDLRACDVFDSTERLASLKVPLLAITGSLDVLTPPKYALFLADRVPDGDARILDGAGHFAMVERPDDTNELVRAFVERLTDR